MWKLRWRVLDNFCKKIQIQNFKFSVFRQSKYLSYSHSIFGVKLPLGWEPRSSGYGRRLVFQRSWVRIPAPYTGWIFFTFICCKKCNICLKRRKQAGSGYWKNYLLLVHHNTKVRIHFQWNIPLHGGRQCHDSPQKDTAWICSRRRSCATPYLCVSSFRLEQVLKVFFPIRKMSASFRCRNYEAKNENIYFLKWANPGLFFVSFQQ